MPDTDSHSMQTLAPLVDEIREIARDELPSPQTFEMRIWDDGGYDIYVHHSKGSDESEQVGYDTETGDVLWPRREGPS